MFRTFSSKKNMIGALQMRSVPIWWRRLSIFFLLLNISNVLKRLYKHDSYILLHSILPKQKIIGISWILLHFSWFLFGFSPISHGLKEKINESFVPISNWFYSTDKNWSKKMKEMNRKKMLIEFHVSPNCDISLLHGMLTFMW